MRSNYSKELSSQRTQGNNVFASQARRSTGQYEFIPEVDLWSLPRPYLLCTCLLGKTNKKLEKLSGQLTRVSRVKIGLGEQPRWRICDYVFPE